MRELVNDGKKIAKAVMVLQEAGLLDWEKDDAENARATLTLLLCEQDDEQDEPVVVLSCLVADPDEPQDSEMAASLTCFAETEAHVLRDVYSRVVWGEKKQRGTARRKKVIDISKKKTA
jgi:hypothetical protein